MNILIINQPTKNRGDEAAHKAFMRSMLKKCPTHHFEVLFANESENVINQMKVIDSRIKYTNVNSITKKGKTLIIKISFFLGIPHLALIHPVLKLLYTFIKKSDYVICAPGGISMGAFHNWEHIYLLHMAEKKKKTAYFSRSFGPFPAIKKIDHIYNKYSFNILRKFDYLSIRDQKTMDLAKSMNLKYVDSIDSVFLDADLHVIIPSELEKKIGKEYCVFIPNSLTWHPHYQNISQKQIDELYKRVFEILAKINQNLKIVMLPQLFEQGIKNDYKYFVKIKDSIPSNQMIAVDDSYNSEVQQAIIAKAKFVIGARYHSIVFALNNNVPFISLAYEHKMNGLLEMLNLQDRMIDISTLRNNSLNMSILEPEIKRILDLNVADASTIGNARKIAENGLNQLCEILK